MVAAPGPLRLDADELASCVQCGLCLPHCPTFRVTGDEAASPRGRIALMRLVSVGALALEGETAQAMESCVQCRGCEPACPSGVPFGHLMELTREAMAPARVPRWQRTAYRALGRHRLLLALSTLGGLAQRARLVPRRLVPVDLPVRRPALAATGTDAWLFTGCVMDAWQREVHVAAVRVLAAAGLGVSLPDPRLAGCCGALHAHAGLLDDSRRLAHRTMQAFPGEAPIVVDSAGCGAALLDYGRLVGTPEASAFSARVRDIHTVLADRVAQGELPPARRPVRGRVAVQDPCHLRHVQRAHPAVRVALRPYVGELVELDDEGLCCGAGGAYAALQPDLAGAIRERKLAAVQRSGAAIVASANPGCTMHLAAPLAELGVQVVHPVQLIDQALQA